MSNANPIPNRELGRGKVPFWILYLPCIGVVLITLGAGLLRLHRLGEHSLWLDEAYSVVFTCMPMKSFWKLMWNREANMVLYYLLLRGWLHLGNTEFVIRSLSVIFGVASVPAIYLIGKKLFSSTTGIIGAAFLSLHSFHVFVSQEARSYSMLLFLLLASNYLFLQCLDSPHRRNYWMAYAVTSALAEYAHLFAVLALIPQWLSLDPVRWQRLRGPNLCRSFWTFSLLILPITIFALFRNRGQLDWIPPLTLGGFVDAMNALTGYGGKTLFALYASLAIYGLVRGWRSGGKDEKFSLRLLVLWQTFPILAMLFASLHKPIFFTRYVILCVPPMALLAAHGTARLACLSPRVRWMSPLMASALCWISFRATLGYYDAPLWADWKSATHLVVSLRQAGDAICFNGNGYQAFWYYFERETEGSTPYSLLQGSHGVACLGGVVPEQIGEQNRYKRVWLVTTDPPPQQDQWVRSVLARNFLDVFGRSFSGSITVELSVKRQ